MVVGFNYAIIDLRQISGFHWVLQIPPPIKQAATI